ncbi:MAG: glutamine--tRNA ligase, partial [Gemmatimonadota bacterium]
VFNRIVPLKDSWGRKTAADEKSAKAAVKDAEKPATGDKKPRGKSDEAPRPSRGPEPGSKPRVSERRTAIRAEDPVLSVRFDRYRDELGLPIDQADVLTGSRAASDFFEQARAEHTDAADLAAWIATDLRGLLDEGTVGDLPFDGAALGRLAALVADGQVTRRAAKEVLERMVEEGGEPDALVAEMGLAKVSGTDELGPIVDEVLADWAEKVEEYRAGNPNLLGLFIGQVMKKTQGAADPRRTRELLTERLDDSA